MHKAQGINPLCTAQLNLLLTEAALITEKLMNWGWSNLYCPVWVTLHCSNHSAHVSFSPCNVSLLSTFIPARLLAGSLSGEDGRVLPHYWIRSCLKSCSYLCQESLLCFLITANQLLHHHHLSCCFVSHLVETKPTTTGKVQEYTAPMLLQLLKKCSIALHPEKRDGRKFRDLLKTMCNFSFRNSPKMPYVKQKVPKADRGSCQDPEWRAPVWVAQGWVCTQAAKASTLVHASKFPYGTYLSSRMLTFCTQPLLTAFCVSKRINVHLHQKPNQTTQNCIINALSLWGIWISSTCKWNWSAHRLFS